ncbi:YncE family protein [Pontibacter sp. JAM-7]|uniref:YncE family protein n=1 Tax=Pontibacter sp. JAM-7 TaxID=3366581 RepID=UPI003AF61D83
MLKLTFILQAIPVAIKQCCGLGAIIALLWIAMLMLQPNEQSGLVFVADAKQGMVNVYDANSLWMLSQIKTDFQPTHLYIHSGKQFLYVVSRVDRQVGVVDIKTLRMKQRMALPDSARWLCFTDHQPGLFSKSPAGVAMPLPLLKKGANIPASSVVDQTPQGHSCQSQLIAEHDPDSAIFTAQRLQSGASAVTWYQSGFSLGSGLGSAAEWNSRRWSDNWQQLFFSSPQWVNLSQLTNYGFSQDNNWLYISVPDTQKLRVIHLPDYAKNSVLSLNYVPSAVAVDR